MYEIRDLRQIPGEAKRRWFCSEQMDLIVWFDDAGQICGFELCYDKHQGEHAIVWGKDSGFRHMAVDDGEAKPGKYKASPILRANGYFDVSRIHATLQGMADTLPPAIAQPVLQHLANHPDARHK
jgi:hypothetical protein